MSTNEVLFLVSSFTLISCTPLAQQDDPLQTNRQLASMTSLSPEALPMVLDGHGACGSVELPRVDSFNRSDADGLCDFTAREGKMGMREGRVVSLSAGHAVSTLKDSKLTDVRLEAEVTVSALGLNDTGLVARYQPQTQNMYYASLEGSSGNYSVQVWKSIGGVWRNLGFTPVTSGSGKLAFVVSGTSLTVFFNGDQMGSKIIDHSLTEAGEFGLRANLGSSCDNVKFIDPLSPESAPALAIQAPSTAAAD